MGNKSSSLKRNGSTPTMAYGRLRIHESPRWSTASAASGGAICITPSTSMTMDGASKLPPLRSYSFDGRIISSSSPPCTSSPFREELTVLYGSKTMHMIPPQEQTPLLSAGGGISQGRGYEERRLPKLGVWMTPALLCGLSYALYNIFIKLGSYSIHPVLGGVILQFVAALLGLALLAFQYYQGSYATPSKIIATSQGDSELPYSPNITSDVADSLWAYDRPGILWSIGAGLAVGIAEMVSFFVSSMGVPAVHSIPVIIGGSVLFGTVLGFVLLGENLSPRGWCGVLMLVAGIGLVGSDG